MTRIALRNCVMLSNTVWYTALGVGCLHWKVDPNPPWTQSDSVVSAVARKPSHQWLWRLYIKVDIVNYWTIVLSLQ